MKYVKIFYSKKWVENTINDWVITLKSRHQILLPYYSVVWKIIQEKMPKFEEKKKKKKKKKKMTQIHKTNEFRLICFSHYKYHTDIKQPKFSTEIRLIRFLDQNQCFEHFCAFRHNTLDN